MEIAPEETFGLDDKRIRCVEGQGCEKCVFCGHSCAQLLCKKQDRQDKRDVIFVNDTKRENARNEQNKVVAEKKGVYTY